MKGLLAVAAREIRERRIMLLAALCFGFLPLVLPRVPWLAQQAPSEGARGELTANLWLATIINIPLAFAFAIGSSVIARDIGERRLAFYFARPLPGLTIWAGKMLAACLIVLLAFALAALPVVLARLLGAIGKPGFGPSQAPDPRAFLAGWGIAMLFVMTLSNAVAGAFRARSGLLIVDVVALPTVLAALGLVTLQLFEAGAESVIGVQQAAPPNLWPPVALITLILSAAGAAQVVVGRSDPRRGHLVLSAVMWGSLALCVAGYFLYARWVLAATPQDLTAARIETPPAGRHLLISGRAEGRPGYYPTFIVDTATSTVTRLPRTAGWLWSNDGKKGLLVDHWKSEIVTAWLGEEIAFSHAPLPNADAWPVALSPDGSRVLVSRADGAAVWDVATGRELGNARMRGPVRGFFRTPDIVRLYTWALPRPGQISEIPIAELDIKSGSMTTIARITVEGMQPFIRFSPDDSRMLVRDAGGLSLLAADGRPLGLLSAGKSVAFGFVHDGRIAVAEGDAEGARLRVFGAGGGEQRSIPLASVRLRGQVFAGESEAGELVVGLSHFVPASPRTRWETVFVDAATGEIRRREPGLEPAVRTWMSQPSSIPLPGSLGTRLFWNSERDLVWFDAATGKRRTVIARARSQEPEP